MNMNEMFINETSLEGQYTNVEDFLEMNVQFLRCLDWLKKHPDTWKVWKKSSLYDAQITKEKKFHDLRGYRISTEKSTNDLLRKMKIDFMRIEEEPPFWDMEDKIQTGSYFIEEKDITDTSLAEAAARQQCVLSFMHDRYKDQQLKIQNELLQKSVYSIHTMHYMAKISFEQKKIDADTFVKLYFSGTRMNFSRLESEYSLNLLQKDEIEDCIKNFERFSMAESWEDIYNDRTLVYKEYMPSSEKDDWFRNSVYRDKKIYKFRCMNPKRCFGYRDGDTFYALRIERDHKISDNG